MNERIKKILRLAKRPASLDVGWVGGRLNDESPYCLHERLRERFPDVTGVDINAEAVKNLENKGYKVFRSNAEELAIGKTFETIIAGELIEHLSNPGRFLEAAKRHLKPNGRMIITTPYPFAALNIFYALLKFLNTCSNKEHTSWFCPSTLCELAGRYGDKVVHLELVEDYYPEVRAFLYNGFRKLVRPLLPRRLR